MAERRTPEDSSPAPAEVVSESGFAARLAHEDENGRGEGARGELEVPLSEPANGVAGALPNYPPPGPPVLISDIGIGIERKRREAREAWEREYGSGGRREA